MRGTGLAPEPTARVRTLALGARGPERRPAAQRLVRAAARRHPALEAPRPTPPPERRDNDLVRGYLAGERPCFRILVERYQNRIVNFLYRSIGDRERAEDLAQEVFIRVYKHLHRFDQDKKFSTWIYTIASNLAKNELRNRSRNPLVLFQALTSQWSDDHRPLQFEDSSYRPDDLYRKRHLRELVESAVERLPDHHKLVFVLWEIEGKSYEEISEITATNLGTVKSRLNRARHNFAEIIAPHLE